MNRLRVALAAFVLGPVASTAFAADVLPRSGSIHFHTGWRFTGDVVTVADKQVMGHGRVAGVTFNDRGSGPLHQGPANCFDVFVLVEGRGRDKGYCTFSDAEGDRIFTEFTGVLLPEGGGNGTNEITGGTGRYAGIQGSGPWKCKPAGSNGELQCVQRLDYRLP